VDDQRTQPPARRESGFELSYLWRGLPGHPLHPPLTDATIGAYTFAVLAATADVLGISDKAATQGWWLAIFAALLFTIPTALTGFADWLRIPTGTPLWRTATAHLITMLIAGAVFLATLLVGKDSFDAGDVESSAYVLTLVGFAILTLGGWLGGSVVYVHGMRVLNLEWEPTRRAAAPVPTPEKKAAEGD
jgi:uncharacterized membrane protein